LTCDARSFVDMAAGGAITNKTLDDAFMLIENIAFNQFQFQYNEKPSSDLLVCCHQVTISEQPTLNQKHESDSSRDKVELSWVLFDDDDAIISDTPMATQMDTIVQDSPILLDNSFMCEPELQSVEFDIEEPPLGDIDDVLLEIEMEKFTFEDVSNIGSSPFEPEMEIFTIDDEEAASDVKDLNSTTSSTTIAHQEPEMEIFTIDDEEAALDVKEPSSTTSSTNIAHQANYTTIPPMASPVKVVLKLLNHLRYDFNFLNKTCRAIENSYAKCNSLLTFLHGIFYCYAYIIGYSIDDLVGVNPTTFASCLFECYFRLLHVLSRMQTERVRVDIPWDPGGFMAWC
jgi:hypothetical protein